MACALLAPVMMSWSIFKMNWTYIFMDYFADFSFRQKKCFRLSFSWSKSVISINILVCQISIEEQISKMDSPWNISSFAERQSLLTCLMLQVHFFKWDSISPAMTSVEQSCPSNCLISREQHFVGAKCHLSTASATSKRGFAFQQRTWCSVENPFVRFVPPLKSDIYKQKY